MSDKKTIKMKPLTLESLTRAELLNLIKASGMRFMVSPYFIYQVRIDTLGEKARVLSDQAEHELRNVVPNIKDFNKRNIARARANLKYDEAFRIHDRIQALFDLARQEQEHRFKENA